LHLFLIIFSCIFLAFFLVSPTNLGFTHVFNLLLSQTEEASADPLHLHYATNIITYPYVIEII